MNFAPWEPLCSVVNSVYGRACLRASLYTCVHVMHVLVCFFPRKDSFRQQALSDCFWVHSVHSWRILLSPAYLTFLPSSHLFFAVYSFSLPTYLRVNYNIGEPRIPVRQFALRQLSTKQEKVNGNWLFIAGNNITPKRLCK